MFSHSLFMVCLSGVSSVQRRRATEVYSLAKCCVSIRPCGTRVRSAMVEVNLFLEIVINFDKEICSKSVNLFIVHIIVKPCASEVVEDDNKRMLFIFVL